MDQLHSKAIFYVSVLYYCIIVGLEIIFCWQALLEQTGVEAAEVTEVILGQVLAAGQGQNPARQVMDASVGLQNMLWSLPPRRPNVLNVKNRFFTSGFFHEFPRVPDYPSSAVFFSYDVDEKVKTKKWTGTVKKKI